MFATLNCCFCAEREKMSGSYIKKMSNPDGRRSEAYRVKEKKPRTDNEVPSCSYSSSDSQEARENPGSDTIPYGTLVVFGCNGDLPLQNRGRYKNSYTMYQRYQPNGVKPVAEVDLRSEDAKKVIQEHYSSVFNTPQQNIVVKYEEDNKRDMFQIGRSHEKPIDFIVLDTTPGAEKPSDCLMERSTISRFACRIVVNRYPPHLCRLYAAGFDTRNKIFLGGSAPQWRRDEDDLYDGLTTNGVLLMHPKGKWGPDIQAGIWREVSIAGDVYGIRSTRSARERGKTTSESNALRDGSMIDLCGVILLYRDPETLAKSQTVDDIKAKIQSINSQRPQCPVGLMTIKFTSNQMKEKQIDVTSAPHVYINCGHVHGFHVWGKSTDQTEEERPCPICREVGPFVELRFGMEPAFYIDNGPLTHAFCPCGHATTELTVKYWAQVPLPHGKEEFRAACPFCAVPLEGEDGFVKLIFQTD